MFIQPAADTCALQAVMQPFGKLFIGLAVADETRIELGRLTQ